MSLIDDLLKNAGGLKKDLENLYKLISGPIKQAWEDEKESLSDEDLENLVNTDELPELIKGWVKKEQERRKNKQDD